MFGTGLSGREWIATFAVILGCGFLVRLGLWQLDRHTKRQEFNIRVESQQILPPLNLEEGAPINLLEDMEYRAVTVSGVYNYPEQVALRNQVWQNLPGVNLVTPLKIDGMESTVLVDRGWIPLEDAPPDNWAKYDRSGTVQVHGIIRRSTTAPEIGNKSDPIPVAGQGALKEWNLLNVEQIDGQVEGDLLPIYVQQSSGEIDTGPPHPAATEIELSDGPHLGYAGQWFLFALILGIGYPIYLNRSRTRGSTKRGEYAREKQIN